MKTLRYIFMIVQILFLTLHASHVAAYNPDYQIGPGDVLKIDVFIRPHFRCLHGWVAG